MSNSTPSPSPSEQELPLSPHDPEATPPPQAYTMPIDDSPLDIVDVENLPVHSFSIGDFIDMASQLHALEFFSRFVLFVLCGLTHTHRVVLNILSDALDADNPEEDITMLRDYDSLLGVCDDICVRDTHLVFRMTSKPGDDLGNNVHVFHEWQTDNGPISAPLHAIPNMTFATFNERNSIVMLFPGLYAANNQTHYLNKDKRRMIYEDGIRPAMVTLLGARSNELPTNLDDEIFRAQQPNGKLSYTTKTFPSWQVGSLGTLIRDNLTGRGHKWAEGMVYLHMIRGVKNTSFHSVTPWAADEALATFFEQNHISLQDAKSGRHGKWFIDVGLEISMHERCLLWRTDKHADVYQELSRVVQREANRITSLGSSQYVRDFISHFTGASGARISPGVRGQGPYEVAYCQMYVTDKSLTAAKGNGHYAKHVAPRDALRDPSKVKTFFKRLLRLYLHASDSNFSSARVELRVPLEYGTEVLIDFDEHRICNSLLAVTGIDYWGWRAWRTVALNFVWEWQFENERFRLPSGDAVLLNMAVPWLINSLHATPDMMSASRDLLKAILPLGPGSSLLLDEDIPFPMPLSNADGTDRIVPKTERGAFFIRRFNVGTRHAVPFFPGSPYLERDTYITLLGDTLPKILESIIRNKSFPSVNPKRLRNKTTQHALPPPLEGGPPALDLNLAALQTLSIHDGPSESPSGVVPLPDIVSQIFRQFFVDILNLACNSKNSTQGTVMRLTEEEREVATIDVFQETNLARILKTCRWMHASTEIWDQVFDKYFPAKNRHNVNPKQNYPRTVYYPMWNQLASNTDDDTFAAIRATVRTTIFNDIYWLPHAKSDRIWETRDRVQKHRYTQFPSQEDSLPIVCILINGNQDPEWNVGV